MTRLNIRDFLHFKEDYFTICREERNIAAILYHILLLEGSMEKFLQVIAPKLIVNKQEWSIYFEYAFLRDIWNRGKLWGDNKDARNNKKREFILSSINKENDEKISHAGIKDFNGFFGCLSDANIVSPARWNLKKIDKMFHDKNVFHEFKYAFNAKPDIVIHLPYNKAVCIEAKYESSEGSYKCGICKKPIKQTRIQKKIMDLLGFEATFIYLCKEGKGPDGYMKLSWREAFQGLDTAGCPQFICEWIKQL